MKDDVTLIRNYLSKVRLDCKNRGTYEGEFFEKLWRIDNWTESALNALIDLEIGILHLEKDVLALLDDMEE